MPRKRRVTRKKRVSLAYVKRLALRNKSFLRALIKDGKAALIKWNLIISNEAWKKLARILKCYHILHDAPIPCNMVFKSTKPWIAR